MSDNKIYLKTSGGHFMWGTHGNDSCRTRKQQTIQKHDCKRNIIQCSIQHHCAKLKRKRTVFILGRMGK